MKQVSEVKKLGEESIKMDDRPSQKQLMRMINEIVVDPEREETL